MADWDTTYQVSTNHSNTDVDTGTEDIDSFDDSLAKAVEWRYVVTDATGANMRIGVIRAVFDEVADSSPVMMPDEHSEDIGTTLGVVTFGVVKAANTVKLQATVTSDNWQIYVVRTLIGASS